MSSDFAYNSGMAYRRVEDRWYVLDLLDGDEGTDLTDGFVPLQADPQED